MLPLHLWDGSYAVCDLQKFDSSVSVKGIDMSGILEKFFRPQEINLKNPKACSNCGSVKVVFKDGMYVCKVCGFKTDAGRDPERIRQMKRKRLITNIALFLIVAVVSAAAIWFGVGRNKRAEAHIREELAGTSWNGYAEFVVEDPFAVQHTETYTVHFKEDGTCSIDRTHLSVNGKGDQTEDKTSLASTYKVTVNGRKASLSLDTSDEEVATAFSLNVDKKMNVQNLGAILAQYEMKPILVLAKE